MQVFKIRNEWGFYSSGKIGINQKWELEGRTFNSWQELKAYLNLYRTMVGEVPWEWTIEEYRPIPSDLRAKDVVDE